MTERQIHDDFSKWLTERHIPFVHHRMDRKSGISKGWPDYTVCFMSRVIMLEIKCGKGRLSPDQVKMIEYIRRSGNKVEIARSLTECVEAVHCILCEGKPAVHEHGACNYPLEQCFRELKRAVAAVPSNGAGPSFYVGDWKGKTYVFAPDQRGGYGKIREASVIDIANLPKLP